MVWKKKDINNTNSNAYNSMAIQTNMMASLLVKEFIAEFVGTAILMV